MQGRVSGLLASVSAWLPELRKKIERIITTQEGVPDEDCPDIVAERGYWVTTKTAVSERESMSTNARVQASVGAQGALGAMATSISPAATPLATPMAPGVRNDLMALVSAARH